MGAQHGLEHGSGRVHVVGCNVQRRREPRNEPVRCGAARVGAARRTARSDDDARRDLQYNLLSGTIPSSIGNLTALNTL